MAESYEWGDLIQGQIARPKSLLIRIIAVQHLIISTTRRRSMNYVVDIENMRSRSRTSGDAMAIEAERKGSNELINQPLNRVTIRRRVGGQNGEEACRG
jgi:hypothetical protein